jgi:Domain of unknown function (DUF4157)
MASRAAKTSKDKVHGQARGQAADTVRRSPPHDRYAGILALQRTVGNRAVNALMDSNTGSQSPPVHGVPAVVQSVLNGGGRPLDSAIRIDMESRFGYDFRDVRVHTDSEAGASAHALGARAYTVGHHIVLGVNRYAPGTQEGKRLLAHELTHVVQQSQPHATGSAADAEAEAGDTATAALAGQHVQVQTAGTGIQCDADEDARRRARHERMDRLHQGIGAIDAELTGDTAYLLDSKYVDEQKIIRARLQHELDSLQPATPEQAEAILDPGAAQRRKQQAYVNFIDLPKDLQEDMQKWGSAPPEKPVFVLGGTLPSPELQAHAERVARKADEENISIGAAARKVQQEGPKPPPKVWPTDPTKARHELNRRMRAIGGKPAQDPNRKPTEWEKAEIEGTSGGKRNPRNWRTVYNPDTGDIVAYERGSDGYYERRNTKGEITHMRESPMTEEETFLTKPDRELTPFERQHVFIEKEGRRNPEFYRPIYNKSTGTLVGYTHYTEGITRTLNAEGVVIDESEPGLEPSPIQADDLPGVAALGKALGKKVIGKAGQWLAAKSGGEVVAQGGKRLLTGAGKEALEKVGETELKQAGQEGVEELSEAGLKDLAGVGGKEAAELGGKEAVELGGKEAAELGGKEAAELGGKDVVESGTQAPARFSPAPADVGDAAFKARMARWVENAMRAARRNTIGSGGEAAAQASALTTTMDLNALKPSFDAVDTISRQTIAQVKAFKVDTPLSAMNAKEFKRLVTRYDRELRALLKPVEPGVPTKLGAAVDHMATHREAIQAAGAWPNGLARNATPEQIAKFINRQGVLAIPADHVATVRAAVAAKARADPALYGLTEGPGLDKGIERLTARVQSLGLTADEINTINKRVIGIP